MSRKIQVAVITGAHGIKGQVTIHSLIDPDALAGIATFINEHGTQTYNAKFTGRKKNLLIASIHGITDRNAAELLKGRKLFVEENDSVVPVSHRLVDLPARLADGSHYGTVSGIYDFGAGDVLDIKKTDGSEEMLPLTDTFVQLHSDHVVIIPPQYVEGRKK
ncbi:MAG: ribosome maturation factor RimM [Alphaproteobacteria bacterium]